MTAAMEILKSKVKKYVEYESKAGVKVTSVVPEAGEFTVHGLDHAVFSVTTKNNPDGSEWWVVAGATPMNLYAKSSFSTADEAFSMHIGLMCRMADGALSSPDGDMLGGAILSVPIWTNLGGPGKHARPRKAPLN